MSLAANLKLSGTIAGAAIQQAFAAAGADQWVRDIALAAGVAGSLPTRTDDDTGSVTATGHGLSNGDTVDVFWAGGYRGGMTVSGVSGADFDVDGGAGDALPAALTDLVVSEPQAVDLDFEADDLALLIAQCGTRAAIKFTDGSTTTHLTVETPWFWLAALAGIANPMDGDSVGALAVSNGATTAATLTLAALLTA